MDALGAIDSILSSDILILDIIMPWPPELPKGLLEGSPTAGMEVFRQVRQKKRDFPVIVYSATQDYSLIGTLRDDPKTLFISKWDSHSLRELRITVYDFLGQKEKIPLPHAFIVHGHDESAKLTLKNYLQNTLGWPEPTILHEQPNLGRTIIEKFEDYALSSSVVFILLTPDDQIAKNGDSDDTKRQARQNVIFEMGYFVGTLGRKSGRVILLHKGALELPSDLSGVVYIDISDGIEAAGENIRREVNNVYF